MTYAAYARGMNTQNLIKRKLAQAGGAALDRIEAVARNLAANGDISSD